MREELVSIIIATYNSALTLELVLESIRKQDYNNIEILVIDGGSTDNTLNIVGQYNCKLYHNNKIQPTYAKHMGFYKAKGRYVVFLDSDEVLASKSSISRKVDCFLGNKNVVAVTPSGYSDPDNYPFINKYINEFGDPFSFFIYRLSKNYKYYLKTMFKRYKSVKNNRSYTVFSLSDEFKLPIIELAAMGSMIDKKFFLEKYPEIENRPELIWHTFYLLNQRQKQIAILKNDKIIHYSATSIDKYLKKINWRIILNMYSENTFAVAGFSGRNQYQRGFTHFKKYLFIPYVLFILPVFLDSLYLFFTRQDFRYFFHMPLSFYTVFTIIYHWFRRNVGLKCNLPAYGN